MVGALPEETQMESLKQEAARLKRLEDDHAKTGMAISDIREAREARKLRKLVGGCIVHRRNSNETYRKIVSVEGSQATMLEISLDWDRKVRWVRYSKAWRVEHLGRPTSEKNVVEALDRALNEILREFGA